MAIVNRNPTRGQGLVKLLNERTPAQASFHSWDALLSIPPDTDLLVNTTSVGLGEPDEALEIDWDSLLPFMVVVDAIPNPPKTHLIRSAQARGCLTLDGLDLLVNQGALSVKLWTGVEANRGVMRWALERVLGLG